MLLINFPTIQIVLRYSVLLLKTKDTELGNKICILYCKQTRDLNRKLYSTCKEKKILENAEPHGIQFSLFYGLILIGMHLPSHQKCVQIIVFIRKSL